MATQLPAANAEKTTLTHPPPRAHAPEKDEWIEATEVFARAREQMDVGEMLHQETFSLFAAMSAIELMDPKMDIGCGSFREIGDITLPHHLEDHELIAIMDKLLACEVSWMHAHTLPQTVFSCLYHQRLEDVRRHDLLSFMRLQLGTMRLVQNLVQAEQVGEEEDFIAWTYGFRLPPMTDAQAQQIWTEMSAFFATLQPPTSREQQARRRAILDRLRFRVQFFRVTSAFYSPKCALISECPAMLSELETLLKRMRGTVTSENDVKDLLATVFDASVNRHLLTNTPPRTAPVFGVEAAFDALEALLSEYKALCSLSDIILPHGPPAGSIRGTNVRRFSFHNALHALSVFSASHVPSIVTRSLMKHIILNGETLCSEEFASVSSMLLTDMGAPLESISDEVIAQAQSLAPFAEHFFWSLCRNRGRQRRHLVKALATWDRAVELCFQKAPVSAREANGDAAAGQNAVYASGEDDLTAEVFCGKTPLQLVAHEVSARMMLQHWLLGFECNLYEPYEYSTLFFYLGYVLSAGANATASLAGAGIKGAELHASRFALYLLDEGRLWLCRALYSFLDALSVGELWNCSLKRAHGGKDGLFGSEPLWYEQRFGFARANRTGPSYVDFDTFRSLMKLQEESLLEKSSSNDVVIARLEDAASSFLTARRALERASKASKFYGWHIVSDEIRDLARVAGRQLCGGITTAANVSCVA